MAIILYDRERDVGGSPCEASRRLAVKSRSLGGNDKVGESG
jgi:hypothetical protein